MLLERENGIRRPRHTEEVNRSKPHPGFYRQGMNDRVPDCNTESIGLDRVAAPCPCRMSKTAGIPTTVIKFA